MSSLVDNLITYRILSMLVQPFVETEAYKLGIIDENGKNIKRASSLSSPQERRAYTYLHRLVFNMKKIIARTPGGDNRLKSLTAAFFLIRENLNTPITVNSLQDSYLELLEKLEYITLVEEEILVESFLNEEGDGGAPTNNVSGAEVSEPKIKKKDIKKYRNIARRSSPL